MAFKHPNCGGHVNLNDGRNICNRCGDIVDVTGERIHYPNKLKWYNHWVCWRMQCRQCSTSYDDDRNECVCGEKITKVPLNPFGGYAKPGRDNKDTWTGFETAKQSNVDCEGVGFMFSKNGPFVGVDLDDCRDPETGEIEDWAEDIINRLDSFTEISTSGTGVHVFCIGTKPEGKNRTGDVEMYDRGRFFGMTGRWLQRTPSTVEERTEEIEYVFEEYVGTEGESENGEVNTTPSSSSGIVPSSGGNDLRDSEVIEKAKNANDSRKFKTLWSGGLAGYDSHSEARMALLCKLAFWTGGDKAQMNRLYERSSLHPHPTKPGKWDRVRDKELQSAVKFQDEFFNDG